MLLVTSLISLSRATLKFGYPLSSYHRVEDTMLYLLHPSYCRVTIMWLISSCTTKMTLKMTFQYLVCLSHDFQNLHHTTWMLGAQLFQTVIQFSRGWSTFHFVLQALGNKWVQSVSFSTDLFNSSSSPLDLNCALLKCSIHGFISEFTDKGSRCTPLHAS